MSRREKGPPYDGLDGLSQVGIWRFRLVTDGQCGFSKPVRIDDDVLVGFRAR